MPETSTLDQFFTPPRLARKLVEWANPLPGERILEPSAGTGAISFLLPANAVKVEIDPILCAALYHPQNPPICADFLTWETEQRFDLIVGNPPYGSRKSGNPDLDLKHTLKALSLLSDSPNARVCFILQSRFLQGRGRYDRVWGTGSAFMHRCAYLVARPEFDDTPGAPGPRGDYAALDIRPVPPVAQTIQWLPDDWNPK